MNDIDNITKSGFIPIQQASQETNNNSNSRWEVKSQLCQKDRVIKGVALGALALVGLVLFGVSLGLTCGLSSTIFVPGIVLGVSLYLPAGMSFAFLDFSHYENENTAKATVEKIKFSNIENIGDMNLRALNKYGFTSDSINNKMFEFKDQYKELSRTLRKETWRINPNETRIKEAQDRIKTIKTEWINFRDGDLSQDLPNFG